MPTTRIIKQMVDPSDNSVYIYPVTGIYSTFDENGESLDRLLEKKLQSPLTPGSNGQFLMTDGSGNQTWALVHDLSMSHRALTGSGGAFTFANAGEREYVTVETNSTATTLTLNVNNLNEHYILLVNTHSTDTITVGIVGSNNENIVGTGSIDIEAGNFCEIGVIKHTINNTDFYVITERILEPYTI